MQLSPAHSKCLGGSYSWVQQGKQRRHCCREGITPRQARLLTKHAAQDCSEGPHSGRASGKLAVLHTAMLLEILKRLALHKSAGEEAEVSVARGKQVLI